jgi:hypothetical protein
VDLVEVDATVVLLNSPAGMVDMEQVQDHQTHHQSDKVMMVEMEWNTHLLGIQVIIQRDTLAVAAVALVVRVRMLHLVLVAVVMVEMGILYLFLLHHLLPQKFLVHPDQPGVLP